jgi:hypothetical protein
LAQVPRSVRFLRKAEAAIIAAIEVYKLLVHHNANLRESATTQ